MLRFKVTVIQKTSEVLHSALLASLFFTICFHINSSMAEVAIGQDTIVRVVTLEAKSADIEELARSENTKLPLPTKFDPVINLTPVITVNPNIKIERKGYLFLMASPIIVFLGICLNGYLFYCTVRAKKKEVISSIQDDYWFRKVICPDIEGSAKALAKKNIDYWQDILNSLTEGVLIQDKDLSDYLAFSFQSKTEIISIKVEKLSKINAKFSLDAISKIQNIIDEYEQQVVNHCLNFENTGDANLHKSIADNQISLFEKFSLDIMLELMNPHQQFRKS